MEFNLTTEKKNYQTEQDELLQTILNGRFFYPWKNPGKVLTPAGHLEIYLTSLCNQKCEYCYLVKYPELYPKDKLDPQLILVNLEKIYQWILKEDFTIPRLEFFNGEIWHNKFGWDVLQLTEDYLRKGMKVKEVLIPSNGSFLRYPEAHRIIESFINKYRGSLNVNLQFSLSVDGAIIENMTRPLNSGLEKTDGFYDTCCAFAKKYGFGFHPMLSAVSAKYWIDNWKWWEQQLTKYNMDTNSIMLLEVRNNDWTEEAIGYLQDFCRFLLEETIEKYHGNLERVCEVLFAYGPIYERYEFSDDETFSYMPHLLAKADEYPGCTIADSLTIRAGDLAICPCHRLAYNKFLYGWFKLNENGEIDTITAHNPAMAQFFLFTNVKTGQLGCDTCLYQNYCLRGCHGMQVEENKDPLFISPKVCNMLKKKYSFLIKEYKRLGILDYLKEHITPYHPYYLETLDLLAFYDAVVRVEGEI